jgi:hypothetical protein
MRTNSRVFRLTATTAIVGLAIGPLLSEVAFAQSPPPPLAPPAASPAPAPQTSADPPTRVGALSRLVGQVSFHGVGAEHWDDASLNFPVTSGDAFWTQPAASADISVTSNRVTMDQQTELDVTTLDDHSFVATIPQGQVYLQLATLAPGETYTVTTPRGTAAITAPGQYEIAAGDTQNPTRITVLQGAAQVTGPNPNQQVAANQTLLITGTDPFQTQVVPVQRDAFLTAQVARDQPPAPRGGVSAPPVVAQMTGGNDLYEYGTYIQDAQYGTVWYPQVASGYVPYRNGYWSYVAPWGWTWVDAAPWGFAPFHYGRWVDINNRWGWVPGGGAEAYGSPGYVAPVYAPALVTFFGLAAVGAAVGIAASGGFGGNVGWCPLGWQEPYRPWYHTSPGYLRNVNVTSVRNVTNITTINNKVTINNFANRAGATMVPASAMVASRPISHVARPIPAAQYADARAVVGRDPVLPTTATAGVTPRVAQNLHLAAPPPGVAPAARPQAPGPAIRAQATAPNERPPLETNGRPAAAPNPNEPGRAGEPGRTGAPNQAVTEHAPGPPIEPHNNTAGAPALRPPAEATRTEERPGTPTAERPRMPALEQHPGGPAAEHATTERGPTERGPTERGPTERATTGNPAEVHPGPAAGAETRQAPRGGVPAVQAHPQIAEPQARPQVHEPAPQPHVAQSRPAEPTYHAPAPVVHAAQPAPRPPEPQVRAAPAAPRPQPQAHPQEHRQEGRAAPAAPARVQQAARPAPPAPHGGGGKPPHHA